MRRPSDPDTLSSRDLVSRARRGDRSALGALLNRHVPALHRWAHRRLPRWVRSFSDTADFVQEAVIKTIRRLDRFEPKGEAALQAYLRQAVQHRITDLFRRDQRRARRLEQAGPTTVSAEDDRPSPEMLLIEAENDRRYREALARLSPDEQRLIVARVELGYNYRQLALVAGKSSPDAARMALTRAVARLVEEMARV